MFYINPTPLSLWIWLGLWALVPITALVFYAISKLLIKDVFSDKPLVNATISGIVMLVVIGILAGMSAYHNYTHSSSYVKDIKAMKIEYDSDKQVRNIKVLDYQGKEIYNYTGKFSFDRSGHGLNLVDNQTGKKISIYIGDNDSVIVTDR
ncbi:hypothetical protein [Convivina praedatoris]|uniref:Uncharacterized protein n=2 Tax=Convivina praedatoris TaxID=2880963 RepID=A0ABM9D618_9LACO|nr:hypothetical protein [Convivina sp. LMG 32447]CAH1855948.1 hypothetical protein R078138_01225 [Convivina sp. LMG 32447]CAH1857512.1 hypothetical protein LMG032447_01582 [Convivina sp. LMG 32447]